MKVIITEDCQEDEPSSRTAPFRRNAQPASERIFQSPLDQHQKGCMKYLVPLVKKKKYFEHVHFYNIDEIPFKEEKKAAMVVTMTNLHNLFLDQRKSIVKRIHLLDWTNYETQDGRIKADGGLDIGVAGGWIRWPFLWEFTGARQNLEI